MSRVLLAALLVVGCAKGAAEDDRTTTTPRADAGPRRDQGPPRDSGPGGRDTGPPEMCDDDAIEDTCAAAEDLGDIMAGSAPMMIEGFLPVLSDEDWYAVRFPAAAMGPGGGAISIELSGDATTVMTLEGPTCGPRAACGEGMAGAITSYSFTDDQDMAMTMPYQTRDTPWPETLFVRVHRSGGPATCTPYTLTISR